MKTASISVKNMVCNRCIKAVEEMLNKNHISYQSVELGSIHGADIAGKESLIKKELEQLGFEWIDSKLSKTIEKIKTLIIDKIHHSEVDLENNWSEFLQEEINYEYKYLSGLFSSIEGITLEQYIILQKIERVKELLFYDNLTLSEIAFKLGYSSVSHLSSQFKHVTGMSPSQMKKTKGNFKLPLDKVTN